MPRPDGTPLLQEVDWNTLREVRDSLAPLCPPAVISTADQIATESGRTKLLWDAARRSVIADIDAAIEQAKKKARSKM